MHTDLAGLAMHTDLCIDNYITKVGLFDDFYKKSVFQNKLSEGLNEVFPVGQ